VGISRRFKRTPRAVPDSKRKQEITDLESLDHAYVVAPNKIDEDRNASLIKNIFKPWPPV
jgi:hypothetical protein